MVDLNIYNKQYITQSFKYRGLLALMYLIYKYNIDT